MSFEISLEHEMVSPLVYIVVTSHELKSHIYIFILLNTYWDMNKSTLVYFELH